MADEMKQLTNQHEAESPVSNEETVDRPVDPESLPILPVRNMVPYPLTVFPLVIGQERSKRLIDEVSVGNRQLGLVASKDPSIEQPGAEHLHQIGTLAVVQRLAKDKEGAVTVLVQCLERIRIEEFVATEPYLKAKVVTVPDVVAPPDDMETQALTRELAELFNRMVGLVAQVPDDVRIDPNDVDDPRRLVYAVSGTAPIRPEEGQQILELDSVKEKMKRLIGALHREIELLELGKKINTEVREEMDKSQREYFLRQQLKAIKQELGEEDAEQARAQELREKIEKAGMPEEAEREALRELDRLEKLPPASPEYGLIDNYLGWLAEMPWSQQTEDKLDIGRARQILDEDHYDLEKIKERILEYLAVRKMRFDRSRREEEAALPEKEKVGPRQREGVILCFVGPPGVGKTSLGKSIARALDRKFNRMSLGGIRDEAEIRGHRRTYIGAMPGRIIQAIRRVESRNPVIMLDEIDKVGADWRGDPSSALLEVLDPEQNSEFRDHYLGVAFDLSEVMFITTANMLDTIPAALRDRMEVLQLSGYIDDEKLHIAKNYLIGRQLAENGLTESDLAFDDDAVRQLIHNYTREAGVRELERQIGAVCRKAAARIAESPGQTLRVDVDTLPEFLGKRRYYFEVKERTEVPGVATGLAMTPAGGDILFIEATRMPGGKNLTITGQLGDVMKESAQAALSYIRSQAERLGIDEHFFESSDIHIHVPAGAVPKDGPSAGVAIAVALASLLTGRLVRSDVGMTGEITLRGKVLPVGGIKEKVFAAHRADLKKVILPARNEPDLDDVPRHVREDVDFQLVDRIDEVLEAALEPAKQREPVLAGS